MSSPEATRRERRSLQASLKLAAEKSQRREPPERESPDRVLSSFERSKQTQQERNKVLDQARRKSRELNQARRAEPTDAYEAEAAREIAAVAEAAVKHESLLAAEVEYALRSPKHSDKEFNPSPPTPKSKARQARGNGWASPKHSMSLPSPRSQMQMQSADEILKRISQLEQEQKSLSQTQAAHGEAICSSQQDDGQLEPDQLVAAALARVREEVLEEIDERVESTVEQDIRSVSKVLVERINDLTAELENERAASVAAAEASDRTMSSLKLRMETLELEERKRKEKGDGCACVLQ